MRSTCVFVVCVWSSCVGGYSVDICLHMSEQIEHAEAERSVGCLSITLCFESGCPLKQKLNVSVRLATWQMSFWDLSVFTPAPLANAGGITGTSSHAQFLPVGPGDSNSAAHLA